MSSEAEARGAARTILEGRLATAREYLIPTSVERALPPSEVVRRTGTKLDWEEGARLNLLVAQHIVERPMPSSTGKPWTSRFAHSMALHFSNSAKDDRDPDLTEQRLAPLLVAAYAFQRMLGFTAAIGTKRRIDQLIADRRDWDWVVSLGMSQSAFQQAIDSFESFHKMASSRPPTSLVPTMNVPVSGANRADRPETGLEGSPDPAVESISSTPPRARHKKPTWLALGPAEGTPDPASAPAWRWSDDGPAVPRGELDQALAYAWDSLADGSALDTGVLGADAALRPVYASTGLSWRPVAGPDGHMLWNWLRFVRLAASAFDASSGSRHLAAVSSAELLIREEIGVADPDSILEQLVDIAMSGLRPVLEKPLSVAFAAYSGRLAAALGHEQLFEYLEYSNEDRARTREVWAQEFRSLKLTARSSSADFTAAIKKAYREYRYRAAEQVENYELSGHFLTLVKSSSYLFDTTEGQLAKEALALLSEALTVAKSSATAIDVPAIHELDDALQNIGQEVCASGSLLLQDTVYPALRGARVVLADKLSDASRVSHPELSAQLISAKLPLTAKGNMPFKVRFRIRNSGNSIARELWVQASADCLTFETPGQQARDLAPAAEEELSFQARSNSPCGTAGGMLRLTWRDDLGQNFEIETPYLAEDQRPSVWTVVDANPYTLSSISDPQRLVGRSAELASLEGILRMCDSSYVTGRVHDHFVGD